MRHRPSKTASPRRRPADGTRRGSLDQAPSRDPGRLAPPPRNATSSCISTRAASAGPRRSARSRSTPPPRFAITARPRRRPASARATCTARFRSSRRGDAPAAHRGAASGQRQRRDPRLSLCQRGVAAGAAAALLDAGTAAARRRRERTQRGAHPARHGRLGKPVPLAAFRRGAVRPRAAARHDDALPHPAGQPRTRAVQQAERRAQGPVPALHLRRHGRGAVPPGDGRAARRPPAAGHGHVHGLHALVALGGAPSRVHGRRGAARLRPHADRRPEPDDAPHDHRGHPRRSRLARRHLLSTAARAPRRPAAALHDELEPAPAAAHCADARLGGRLHHPMAARAPRRDGRERHGVPVRGIARLRPAPGPGAHHRPGARYQFGGRSRQSAGARDHGAPDAARETGSLRSDSDERHHARPRHSHRGSGVEAVLRTVRGGARTVARVAEPEPMTVTVGQRARRSLTLSPEHVATYAKLTGDYNPLHFDPAFAAQTRFKALVVQGGLTTGLLHALVAMDLPGPGTVFLSQNWKYTAPVYIGDTITAEAEVVSVHDTKPVCRLKVTVTRQTGETVLEGEAWCYTFSA